MIHIPEGVAVPMEATSYKVEVKSYPIGYTEMTKKEIIKAARKYSQSYEYRFNKVWLSIREDERRRIEKINLFLEKLYASKES